jgi:kynurenine formamidase
MTSIKKIIDLNQTTYHDQPSYPGLPRIRINRLFTLPLDIANVSELHLHTHAGTHIDAPYHFEENGETLDNIPLDRLVGEAVVINLPKKPNEGITLEDLKKYEKQIKKDDIVIINTGWYKKRGFNKEWLKQWPYLTKEAAEWLRQKKIKAIGIDVCAIDQYGTQDFPAHHILLSANIPIIEELANLDEIKTERTFIVALPLKIVGSDAAPARVIAITF